MIQNSRQRNLQGRSFKGAYLTDADFSGSDIRGADFTDAKLSGANFSRAKAGLPPHWSIALFIAALLLSALAGVTAGLTGIFALGTFGSEFINRYSIIPCVDVILTFGICTIVTVIRGFVPGLVALTLTIAILALFLGGWGQALTGTASTVLATGGWMVASVAGSVAIALAVGIAGEIAAIGTAVLALLVSFMGSTHIAISTAMSVSQFISFTTAVTGIHAQLTPEALDQVMAQHSMLILAKAIAGSAILTGLNSYISWRAVAWDEKHILIRNFAIALASLGGTQFRGADLTNADFSAAELKSTDFSHAKSIDRTCWHRAKKLNWAKVGNTILSDRIIQDLLVTGKGYGKSYANANLCGANLNGADLRYANFKEADLSQATLKNADLEGANLTKAQAIGTDFTNARLTGVCGLEWWNIDSATQLDAVDCQYVYLQEPNCERLPSSGEFAPGDFTNLFQKVVNTVDLIFRDGFDWKAFSQSFKNVQSENQGTEIEFISFEKKGDGVFVVKVKVPSDADKFTIHSQFMNFYKETLDLTAHQQKFLESHTQEIKEEIKHLRSIVDRFVPKMTDRFAMLSLGVGDFERGFAAVTAQIFSNEHPMPIRVDGQLPPNSKIPELYRQWHQKYDHLRLCYQAQGLYFRIKPLPNQIKQVSFRDIPKFIEEIQDLANQLKTQVNTWLDSGSFSPIENQLRSSLSRDDHIQIIIQSEDLQMRHLPWHLWDFFEVHRKAEVAFSPTTNDRVTKSISPRNQVRILAILGNSEGINVDEDRQLLEDLPDAETVFLVEPSRQEFNEALWDQKGWDILCFSGHSSSQWDGISGYLEINQTDKLTIEQLKNALQAAIERGLHLAIFNSCDGLGLAQQLNNLQIPQIIVMREFVPDLIAQEFLKHFLTAFSGGKSLHLSVREAREKLQSMEDKFPCASWLPAICQNQAELPKTWQELRDAG